MRTTPINQLPTCRREQHAAALDADQVVGQRIFPHREPRARGLPGLDRLAVAARPLRDPGEQLSGGGGEVGQRVHP
jgi:hypothetical protein